VAKRFTLPAAEYKELTARVLQRDGKKCRSCGLRSRLNVHHIVFRSDSGGDLSHNLCTLCGHCHDAVHGKISNLFIIILAADGNPETLPDADYGLRFKRYKEIRRRITWKFPTL
jgi:hypothetical protein